VAAVGTPSTTGVWFNGTGLPGSRLAKPGARVRMIVKATIPAAARKINGRKRLRFMVFVVVFV
jgi:hypothetical protein